MRIALMTNNYKPIMGGVPISIERLARGLRDMGHQVTIFAPSYEKTETVLSVKENRSAEKNLPMEENLLMKENLSMEEERAESEEEGVFRYSVFMKHFIGGIVLPNPCDRRIEEEFAKNRYDIIHVHHPVLIGQTAVYLSKKYNVPLTFTYHTRYEQYVKCYTKGLLRFDKVMPLYLHTFLRHCNYVFAPTAGMREYLVDRCGMSPEKTGVLPTGIERENFRADGGEAERLRKSVNAEGMPLLITISRMAQEKNVEFLLESLALAKEYYRKPFRMLMIGDGPDRQALERKCGKLGLADYVVFTGAVPNERIASYCKAADLFLFASKTETQGIVILEAFAGETPVIAVRASGVEDLVEDGKNGFLTVEEPHVYAAQLVAVLNGAYDRRTLGENAGRTAEQYREDAVAMKAIRYYNNAIAEHVADNIVNAGNAAAGRGHNRKVWRGCRHGAEVSHFSG